MFTLLKKLRRTRLSFCQNICHQLQLLLAFNSLCSMTSAEEQGKGLALMALRFVLYFHYGLQSLEVCKVLIFLFKKTRVDASNWYIIQH